MPALIVIVLRTSTMLADICFLIVQLAMPMLGLFGAAYVFFSAQQV